MTKVKLWKKVDYQTLEKVLVKSAEEIGWKAKIKDNFKKGYKLSLIKETKEYNGISIILKGSFLPIMTLHFFKKNPIDFFYIWDGIPFGVATTNEIKKYINTVSKNL